MNDDLISRAALKKALEVTQYNDIDDLTRTERLIDNAQPVVNEYTKGFADGERSGRNFPLTDEEKAILVRQWRPHGEWEIEKSSETGALGIKYTLVRCSQCGWDNSLAIPRNFCPNCGADNMRGERE